MRLAGPLGQTLVAAVGMGVLTREHNRLVQGEGRCSTCCQGKGLIYLCINR